jgi:hypothetical protein
MSESASVLVMTVWSEAADPSGLRARVRFVRDVMSDEDEERTLAGRTAILALIAGWLDDRTNRACWNA